jgi:hypothetical protein
MNWRKQLLSRRHLYEDGSEDMQQHLEEKIEELVPTRVPRKEVAAARRDFGSLGLVEQNSRMFGGGCRSRTFSRIWESRSDRCAAVRMTALSLWSKRSTRFSAR